MLPRRPLLLLLWLAVVPANSSAESNKPQQVLDLHYGEVLFHFYQEDYFTAITHLMVAREENLLQHHGKESELLLGGLQLSYGMLDEAEAQFHRMLDTDSDSALHDRVWYYLTKINYQRGHYQKAYSTLQDIGKPRDKALAAELALLSANINMELGNNADAAEALQDARAPEGWKEYLEINRGIALMRAGEIEQGRQVLDKLGKKSAGTEELRALRDRANLGLGYELLRAGDPELAREYLNRVRLQGPFVQAALLGAGWADAELGDYESALTPWMNLVTVGGHQPAAQEAQLAVPYALAQMGDGRRAVDFYEQALTYYDNEQQQIEQAIEAARSGTLISLLSQADTGTSGGWLHDNPTLQGVPSGRYLVDVLSGNNFQESLKDYRDLGYLSKLLNQWLNNMDLYYDMVDARRQAYEQRAPKIRERLDKQEAAALQARWQHYRDQLAAEREDRNPVNLATGKEKQQWELLETVQSRLARLPDEPRYNTMRAKAEWLKGVLYWQLQADYQVRLWDVHKQLAELEPQVADTLDKHQQISAALENVKAGFDGYNERIEALRARILALLPRIAAARGQSGQRLQHLALEELETRKQRLISYRSQARYALARSYDQLARTPGAQP
jgi:predicted negative regulator of RcsB-dependent stress response